MTTKVYGIDGIVEASYLFTSGKAKLRAEFKDGIVDEGRQRPATLTTKNPLVQIIIEHQPLFKNGNIRIVSSVVENTADTAPATKGKGKKKVETSTDREAANSVSVAEDGSKVYDMVTNIGQAVNVLMDLGATADQLTSPTDALAVAAKLNVTFPNLKLK